MSAIWWRLAYLVATAYELNRTLIMPTMHNGEQHHIWSANRPSAPCRTRRRPPPRDAKASARGATLRAMRGGAQARAHDRPVSHGPVRAPLARCPAAPVACGLLPWHSELPHM